MGTARRIRWNCAALFGAALLLSAPIHAYWALDVSSQWTGSSATTPGSGNTSQGGGFYSWYFYGSWSGSAYISSNAVNVDVSAETYASTSFYRCSVTNLVAYSGAGGYAYAYWRWYGTPGASTAINAHMRIDIDGYTETYGSVSASQGGSASTTSYGQSNNSNQAWHGNGSQYAYGYASAWGTASAWSQGNATLNGSGATWSGNNVSHGVGYYGAYGYFTVWMDSWYYGPTGLPFMYAYASGNVTTRSTSNSYSPPGGNLNMGGSDAWAYADGVSWVSLSW